MFVVQLRLSDNKSAAAEHMAGHQQWIADGFTDQVFLLVGNLEAGNGGAVVAHNLSRSELEERVATDPFVAHNVVQPEIIEIAPGQVDERLSFLQEA